MSLRFSLIVSLLALGAATSLVAGSKTLEHAGKDRTITKVVKLLQDMLETSKKEGDEEKEIYGKFKCYCDTTSAAKKANIEANEEKISILSSKIEELLGDNGELSADVAELKQNIADNQDAQDEATAVRDKQNKAFKAFKSDAKTAIDQMDRAIKTLGEVGADQTKKTGADSKQFLAGYDGASLLSLQANVQQALKVASLFLDADGKKQVSSFLQAPFTGTYTSQSAGIMGILKDMRDTFKKNLADAITAEGDQLEAYDEFMKIKKEAKKEMEGSYKEKQGKLGDNDEDLSSTTRRRPLPSASPFSIAMLLFPLSAL
jgi:hypothetical protein